MNGTTGSKHRVEIAEPCTTGRGPRLGRTRTALVVFVAGLTACTAGQTTAPANTPALPTAPGSESEASATPRASASPSLPADTGEPSSDANGFLAEVLVTELIVRSQPGTGTDSEIYPGVVDMGTRLWMSAEAVAASGYEWHLAVAEQPPLLAEDPTVGSGWVAIASREGEPWIRAAEADCPGAVSLEAIAPLSPAERFLCFGGDSIQVTGWVPPPFPGSGGCGGEEPGWLLCFLAVTPIVSIQPPAEALAQPGGAPGWDASAARIDLHFPPPQRPPLQAGDHVVVIGHFDDPASAMCGTPGFPDATEITPHPALIYQCRGKFVVESVRAEP